MGKVTSVDDDLAEERRRSRRAGDPRLSSQGRELFARMTTGDLVDEFQTALESDGSGDSVVGGGPDPD